MINNTFAYYRLLKIADVYAQEYRFTDLVLLSDIRFYKLEDFAPASDKIMLDFGSNLAEVQQTIESVVIHTTSGILEDLPAIDVCALTLDTGMADACSASDLAYVDIQPYTADSARPVDVAAIGFTLYIDTPISLNEFVGVGQDSLFEVNNIAVAIDNLNYDYTDSIPVDLTAASDVIDLILRPKCSSVLGTCVAGGFALGA